MSFIALAAVWFGLVTLQNYYFYSNFLLAVLILYTPVGFILWFFIGQIVVYRAIMQELREFGPEGIVTREGFVGSGTVTE